MAEPLDTGRRVYAGFVRTPSGDRVGFEFEVPYGAGPLAVQSAALKALSQVVEIEWLEIGSDDRAFRACRRRVHPAALDFMNWVRDGLLTGRLAHDRPQAPVQFVAEGMLLVSPTIFRRFVAERGERGDGRRPVHERPPAIGWLQRRVVRAGWHRRVDGTQGNFVRYDVVRGGQVRGGVSGLLIEQPERWLWPVPASNPHLLPANTVRLSTGSRCAQQGGVS